MGKPETHCEINFPKVMTFTTSTAPDQVREDLRFVFEARGVNRADTAEVGDVCKQLERCVQEFKDSLLTHAETKVAK
jgi:hypothetical protein